MDSIFTFVSDQLTQNQFLSGGAMLAVLGIGFAYLRNIPGQLYNWLRRRFVLRIDILDRDEAFKWLVAWLAVHPYCNRCRLISIKTSNSKLFGGSGNKDTKKRIILSPAPGPHFFFYKKRLVILRRSRQEGGDLQAGLLGIQEKFDLTIFSRDISLVNSLLEEAREIANPEDSTMVNIYRAEWSTWILARKQPTRDLSSIVLNGNNKEILIEDIKDFQSSESWYKRTGVPYRRGYLLHGPPGNGKSSIVIALASELNLNICVLTLSSKGINDEKLMTLCSEMPANSLILLEDIDCACIGRETEEGELSLSGLLNAIDGITATEGRIMFMTTNNIEKLDPAIIRPGRCDLNIQFNNSTQTQAEGLFLTFYPNLKVKAKEFGIRVKGISMAHLQGLLIKGKNDPEGI